MPSQSRRLLSPDDAGHYRWLLQLDSAFQQPALPRGFDYEAEIDQILEMIWSPRMTNVIGIDLYRFKRITKISIVQQKRDLLDVALTLGLSRRAELSLQRLTSSCRRKTTVTVRPTYDLRR